MTEHKEFEPVACVWCKGSGKYAGNICRICAGAGLGMRVNDTTTIPTADYEKIKVDAERYSTVRKLKPREFADIYKENIRTGVHFDRLISQIIELKEALDKLRTKNE